MWMSMSNVSLDPMIVLLDLTLVRHAHHVHAPWLSIDPIHNGPGPYLATIRHLQSNTCVSTSHHPEGIPPL